LSGKFPTKAYYSTYEPLADSLDSLEDFGTESDRAAVETIRKHGKKCNSVCCTGAFIIEVSLGGRFRQPVLHYIYITALTLQRAMYAFYKD
jgi:hypothetical protein